TIGILLFLVIIFTGYLVIYNIFSISISKDIRLYGMLKTVGTTPTQIKKIVRNQVYSLALIGIPIGLLLGYGLGAVLLPTIIASLNIDKAILSVNPIIFIGSSLFALLTIYLGSRKPAKIASKITPVEALRYQNTNIKKAVRKSNNTKIYKLAWNNLIRDKKKSIIIITTMFLSLIILNSAFSFSKGMSMEKFVETMISSDYTVASSRYFKYQFNENSDSTSDVLINKIDSSGIVEEGTKIYYTSITHILSDDAYNNFFDYYNKLEKEEKLNGYEIEAINGYKNREFGIPISAYGMNAYGANKLEIKVGTFDAEKFLSGRYIILGAYSDISTESHYNAGDKVTLDFKGVSKSYEVMAIADLPYSMSVKYYPVGSIDCFIPNTEFERIYEKPSVMSYIFDIKAGYENEMDTLLQDFTTINDKTMDYNSKQTISKEFDDTKKMLLIVGGMLSFTIGLISIANFINSMFASIITRRTELAMMKSIGMTKKQLRRMLGYEGLYYGGIPVFLALIMEVGFRNFFARTLASQSWAFDYQFTILPLLVVAPVFLVISLMIPYFANKKASNISLIEQLRGAE
ncbi:MAG: FtsX-like permease family protein, partial [Clostridiales bacterium]|nr:FtsX-like permease family protein [Clostridiales bacterium]